jgi:hypothetical protein
MPTLFGSFRYPKIIKLRSPADYWILLVLEASEPGSPVKDLIIYIGVNIETKIDRERFRDLERLLDNFWIKARLSQRNISIHPCKDL